MNPSASSNHQITGRRFIGSRLESLPARPSVLSTLRRRRSARATIQAFDREPAGHRTPADRQDGHGSLARYQWADTTAVHMTVNRRYAL